MDCAPDVRKFRGISSRPPSPVQTHTPRPGPPLPRRCRYLRDMVSRASRPPRSVCTPPSFMLLSPLTEQRLGGSVSSGRAAPPDAHRRRASGSPSHCRSTPRFPTQTVYVCMYIQMYYVLSKLCMCVHTCYVLIKSAHAHILRPRRCVCFVFLRPKIFTSRKRT